MVIDTHQAAGEGKNLAIGYKDRLMDLALRVDIHSAEEEYHSNDSQKGSCDELYVCVIFHRLF